MTEDIKRLVEALRSKEHRQPINPSATYRTRDVSLFEDAARAIEELSAARSEPRPSPEGLVEALVDHWLYQMLCDPQAETDVAHCSCGEWSSDPQPSIGEAAKRWAEHAIAAYTARAEGEK